ncbi:MAG: hypothetical protein ABJA78_06160 [Ferruginibacter sp.]
MKRSITGLFTLIIILSACNSADKKTTAAEKEKQSYDQTKETLAQKEIKAPENFIVVNGHDKHNLIGQTVVKGTVTSKATVAVYKDIDVELKFFSKTGALLETDKETVYETLKPGESESFKTKYFAPKGTDSVALKVLGAKNADK